jgi:hypothetical protein
VDGEGRYAIRWDRREDWAPADLGWIGEDAEGVWMTRHPIAALAEFPELNSILARWEAGQRELTREDYLEMSCCEWDALAIMQCSRQRKDLKRG